MPEEILTVADMAKLLKVTEKTIYTMAQGSEIPCFKVRGQWRFRRLELDEWISLKMKQDASLMELESCNEKQ